LRIPKTIEWNGFLETIVKPSRSKQESCAWIFADIKRDMWSVFEVKNVGLPIGYMYYGEEATRYTFAPDKKDFARVKRLARKLKLTRLGNVHTHIVIGDDKEELEFQLRPSITDLAYARRYNNVVRAVIVVHFPDRRSKGKIYGIVWHDQYGKILKKKRF